MHKFLFRILSFIPRLINHACIIPAYVEINQCTCRDVISRALRLRPAKKDMVDLCLYQLQLMHVQMHVQTGIKIFSLRSYKTYITNKAAREVSITIK